MTPAEFQKLQSRVTQAQKDAAHATGALDGIVARLQKEFGVGTIAAAETLLLELEGEEANLQERLDKKLSKFEEKYREVLECPQNQNGLRHDNTSGP